MIGDEEQMLYQDSAITKFFLPSKLILIFIFTLSLSGCLKSKPIYVFSIDKHDRPITECLVTNKEGLAAIWVSMKCKKTISKGVYICQQGQMVNTYLDSKTCDKAHGALTKLYGPHTLETDEHEINQ